MTPHEVVCAALVHNRRVLLGRRSARRSWYPGVWDLPGGHVDDGEDAAAALVREVEEELGVRIGVPAETPDRILGDDIMHLSAWLIREWEGTVRNAAPEEHDELRWVTATELDELPLAHPAYRGLLAEWVSRP